MLVYGHRGAKGIAPENTLAGFRHCLEAGVTRCELDLQLSLDEQLIVFHDNNLKRLTRRRGKVKHKTAAELQHYSIRDTALNWPTTCPIPTLAQLFACCAFDHWQLEVKPLSRKKSVIAIKAIARLVEQFELQDRVTITSSSAQVLKAAQHYAPHISRGLVAEYGWLDPIKTAMRYQCSLLALNWTLCTEQRTQKAKAAGLHLSVWTVNEPKLMLRLAQYGVDSLITDFPGLASATLGNY